MFKLLIYGVLIYFAYRLFIPKSLRAPDSTQLPDDENDDYIDYEEID